MKTDMKICLVFMSLLSTALSLGCTSRMDYLSAKAKFCMAGDVCYTEEQRLVQIVVKEGCLKVKEDSPEEDGDFGKMRMYVVTRSGFIVKEGQLIRLPAFGGAKGASHEVEEEEDKVTGIPIVEVFSLEDGKIVRTVENDLDPNEAVKKAEKKS